ncbi:MAG TPA: NAD(P)H-dependent oxidoreductase [Acidimicrobiia bacterium]|nr:NAD(P)H-dependent oxidoreductase [Acidimicrobiia bacterium]
MDLAVVVVAPLSEDGRERSRARLVGSALHDRFVVETIDLVAEDFTPAMSRTERLRYPGPDPIVDPLVEVHAGLVRRAAILVFVFPTPWWTPPAVLKAWLERVFVPGVAFELDDRNRLRPRLHSLRAVAGVTTHLHPDAIGDAGDGARRMLLRTMRLNAPRRVRTGWMVDPTDEALTRWFARL